MFGLFFISVKEMCSKFPLFFFFSPLLDISSYSYIVAFNLERAAASSIKRLSFSIISHYSFHFIWTFEFVILY